MIMTFQSYRAYCLKLYKENIEFVMTIFWSYLSDLGSFTSSLLASRKTSFFLLLLNCSLSYFDRLLTFFTLQAVLRKLGSLSNDASMIDEAELLYDQQLQNLYNSTRAAKVHIWLLQKFNYNIFYLSREFLWFTISYRVKQCFIVYCSNFLWSLIISCDIQHFQRNIVRGVEGFISISSKQMEIGSDFILFFWVFDLVHFSSLVYQILPLNIQ